MIGHRHLRELLGDEIRLSDAPLEMRCDVSGQGPLWVHAGRSFVAILNKVSSKNDDDSDERSEGQQVWDYLSDALLAWRPNYYRLMLSEIQNALELDALGSSGDWMDEELCLGLGLYLLSEEEAVKDDFDDNEISGKVEDLTDRFIDLIRRRLSEHRQVAETGREVFKELINVKRTQPEGDETRRHARAKLLANLPDDQKADWNKTIVPRVNAFMASDGFRGAHITTGSILHDGANDKFYVCTSPACDLVPGRQPNPSFMLVAHLQPESGDGVNTPGEKIMFEHNGRTLTCRILGAKTKQLTLHRMLLPDGTAVTTNNDQERSIIAMFLEDIDWIQNSGAGKDPGLETITPPAQDVGTDVVQTDKDCVDGLTTKRGFKVVAQLRRGFAERYLNEAGKHQSRIGVDFIDA